MCNQKQLLDFLLLLMSSSQHQHSILADDGSRYFINETKRLALLKLLTFHFPKARSVEETLYKTPLPCVCSLVGFPSEDEESVRIREHNKKARSGGDNQHQQALLDLAENEAFRAHAGVLSIPDTNLCIFFLQETPYNPQQQAAMQILLGGGEGMNNNTFSPNTILFPNSCLQSIKVKLLFLTVTLSYCKSP